LVDEDGSGPGDRPLRGDVVGRRAHPDAADARGVDSCDARGRSTSRRSSPRSRPSPERRSPLERRRCRRGQGGVDPSAPRCPRRAQACSRWPP
jgi:hypothetical protein